MFRIPSFVRTQLLAHGHCETSRYSYILVKYDEVVPGLWVVDRYELLAPVNGVRVIKSETMQRRVF